MENTMHYLIMACHMRLQKKLFARLRGSGLTLGQPKILDYLKDNNGALQKDIAAACHIEPATLTPLLNGMEKSDLAERRSIYGDRRSCHIFLTEKGREMLGIVTEEFEKIESEAFSGISEQEKQEFMKTLEKLYINLNKQSESQQ